MAPPRISVVSRMLIDWLGAVKTLISFLSISTVLLFAIGHVLESASSGVIARPLAPTRRKAR